jgi:hypothetical protein
MAATMGFLEEGDFVFPTYLLPACLLTASSHQQQHWFSSTVLGNHQYQSRWQDTLKTIDIIHKLP